eukprot:TRINITY_DN14347_c0_g1_i2.p1 TRINITY_DN14347_c0_g1~~TRINITY_DN14347_c0_g1_i2.p1  ORF type:complete len:150 (-),score=16.06 TRINITY_DN14347_c0_g1_i2:72-521(-)
METSLRYYGDSKSLRIHAKENFPLDSKINLQVHGELDTGIGAPSCVALIIRHFYPELSASTGVGLHYDKHQKVRYSIRGKKVFPIASNGLISFNIKGRYEVDREFREVGVLIWQKLLLNEQEKAKRRSRIELEHIQLSKGPRCKDKSRL